MIRTEPNLAVEISRKLPALERAATGHAGESGVKAVIARRFALYPQPARSEGEWAEWWASYVDVLADTPLASLEAAMRAYVANPDSEFLPKPGKLKAMAASEPTQSMIVWRRAQFALSSVGSDDADFAYRNRPQPTAEEIEASRAASEADRKAILAMAESAISTLGGPTKLRRPLPSIAGIPDETGITPQMRGVLARQALEPTP